MSSQCSFVLGLVLGAALSGAVFKLSSLAADPSEVGPVRLLVSCQAESRQSVLAALRPLGAPVRELSSTERMAVAQATPRIQAVGALDDFLEVAATLKEGARISSVAVGEWWFGAMVHVENAADVDVLNVGLQKKFLLADGIERTPMTRANTGLEFELRFAPPRPIPALPPVTTFPLDELRKTIEDRHARIQRVSEPYRAPSPAGQMVSYDFWIEADTLAALREAFRAVQSIAGVETTGLSIPRLSGAGPVAGCIEVTALLGR